eukprot:Phypoly_transcript_23496.p1 GENE.Phypoly_transcript_23496~~Phypoly_transcript_23496.p1  ORF type:complete len:114 (+),score=6.77 Phypoly_transcript_23496:18-359(+)
MKAYEGLLRSMKAHKASEWACEAKTHKCPLRPSSVQVIREQLKFHSNIFVAAELYKNLGPNKAYTQQNDLFFFLVPTWFKLDTNVPGGEYVLMNITDLIPEFRRTTCTTSTFF